MGWQVEILSRVYDYLNKVKRPVFTIIFMCGILGCYLWVKFDENHIESKATKAAIIERQALGLHKSDSILHESRELRSDVCELRSDIKELKALIVHGNRDVINWTGNQLEYIVRYSGQNKDMIIDAIRNGRDAYINKADTLRIGVKKHELDQ